MGRQQQQDATLNVGGRDLGPWAGLTGGDMDSDPTVFYPGGMRPARSLGGSTTTDEVTMSKLLDDLTDDDVRWLIDRQGTESPVVATRLFLDAANRATRRPLVYRGTLKRVGFGEYDAESSDPLLIEIELSITGKPTLA